MAYDAQGIIEFVLVALGAVIILSVFCCCWGRRNDSVVVGTLFGIGMRWAMPLLCAIAPLEFIGRTIFAMLRHRLYVALARFLNGLVCAVLGGFAAYTCAALRRSPPDTAVLGWTEWSTNSLIGAIMVCDPCAHLPPDKSPDH